MAGEPGRREANKQAIRRALQEAALRLFDERGYERTTVRDVAAAAGVTERTFFRYFGGKEELIAERSLDWLPMAQEAIGRRPAEESPLVAIRNGMRELSRLRGRRPPNPLWMFADGSPGLRLRRSAPGLLQRFEEGLAAAIRPRMGADADYEADILARAAVSACRSASLRDWQLRKSGARVPLAELLDQAFDVLLAQSAKPGE